VIGLAVGAGLYFMKSPSVTGVEPERVRVGETVTISGQNLGASPAQNEVLFGDVPARVTAATAGELKVEVPPMRLVPGQDTPVSLHVRSGGREANALSITVYQAPMITRLTPDVAMPGEEITIEGSGWKDAASVRFGAQPAEILSVAPSAGIRVRVPALTAAPATEVPVIVTVSGAESQGASFVIGRLPMVLACDPARALPGDVVRVKGRGFSAEASSNRVLVAAMPALVSAATENELTILMPRVPVAPEGDATVEVHVEGRPEPGLSQLHVGGLPDPIEPRLFAEPLIDDAGHVHAVVGTEIGPAFVLSDAAGKSAALRAAQMVEAWTAALVRLRASLDEDVEVRNINTSPVLGLKGRPQTIVEITEDDAAGYNEGWIKPEPKAPLVTPARLAVWWEAQARDLVLLLLRGKAPENATALSPDGRPLADLHARARKTGRFGLPREVLGGLKPAEREALRIVGMRVPATITVTGDRGAAAAAAAAAGLRLEGTWVGFERETGRRRNISVTFEGEGGTLTYQAGVALSIPLAKVEQPLKGAVKFSAMIRGGVRHYTGRWDGEKMTGTITQEGATPPEVGTFELGR